MSIREDLKAYIDGELDAVRAEEVRLAIEKDPELKKEAEFYRSLSLEIRELVREPQVMGLEKTLRAVQPRRPWWRTQTLGVAVAGAMGVVVLGALFFPVFAQSKESAKRYGRAAAKWEVAQEVGRGMDLEEQVNGTPDEDSGLSYQRRKLDSTLNDSFSDGAAGAPAADAPTEPQGGVSAFSNPRNQSKNSTSKVPAVTAPAKARANTMPAPTGGDTWRMESYDARPPAMIIRTGEIALEVKDVSKAHAAITSMARGLGGYVENSNDSNMKGELPYATAVLRVPQNNFEVALQKLRKIEPDVEVLTSSMSGEDVTLQFADTESELKTLRGAEKRYRAIMTQTKKIGEVLEVQSKLDEVRTQIEGLESTKKVLQRQSAMSTISVTLHQRSEVGQPEPPQDWSNDAWTTAVNGLYGVGRALGQACIFLFVFSPFWVPPLLLAVWLSRRQVRS